MEPITISFIVLSSLSIIGNVIQFICNKSPIVRSNCCCVKEDNVNDNISR